jgi:hypothetical protein
MPLPQIVNPNPVVIEAVPAVEEYAYNESYVVGLSLTTESQLAQRLEVTLRPYNYADQRLFEGSSADTTFIVSDIWAEAARSPLFAQVMGGICQVTSLLMREKYLASLEVRTPEQEAELAQVRIGLGITA